MEMITIVNINEIYVGTHKIIFEHNVRQYYELSDVFVVRLENNKGVGFLYTYGYSKDNYNKLWEISDKNIFSVRPIIPELKKENEFISLEFYKKYLEEFKGKELLEIYESSWPYDYIYMLDANTGEIYSKMETR